MVSRLTAIEVAVIVATAASLTFAATLRVDDATTQVGGSARVAVNLDNAEDNVRALQFTLNGLPAGLQLQGVEAAGRAAGLNADAHQQPDGTTKVVLISLGTETVEAGSGPVLNLHFAVNDTGGQSDVVLAPTEVRVAGADGELDATGQSGHLQVAGASTTTSSEGGCAIGPTRSGSAPWPVLVLAAALLIGRSNRYRC
jgi:hypothetical protein